MAGVYIKGAGMPKGCFECPLKHRGFNGSETVNYCYAICKQVSDDGEIDTDCPLVEVPDHGDLIDREDLLEKAGLCISDFGTPDEMCRPDRDWYLEINAVQKVIPADKEGV